MNGDINHFYQRMSGYGGGPPAGQERDEKDLNSFQEGRKNRRAFLVRAQPHREPGMIEWLRRLACSCSCRNAS